MGGNPPKTSISKLTAKPKPPNPRERALQIPNSFFLRNIHFPPIDRSISGQICSHCSPMEPDQSQNRGGEVPRDAAAEDEISEDEKMEKFYELIRNYKEARDRQRMERERSSAGEEVENGGSEEDERRKRTKKMRVGDREESSWIPAFKWEDFADKAEKEFRWRPVAFPASNLKQMDKRSTAHGDVKDPPPITAEVDGGGELDLKLRL